MSRSVVDLFRGYIAPSEAKATSNFDKRLEACKPLLFNLACQLIDAYPERRWNLLVGDDTSGRLPTRFVRKVFAESGIAIPTGYIAASRSVNHTKPLETYLKHAQNLTKMSANHQTRGLLITESAGETLGSIRFTHDLLSPHCDTLDTAIVASRGAPDDSLGEVYASAFGDETALHSVWTTFEHPLQTRKGPQWSGALTNLEKNPDPTRGDARITSRTDYRRLAHYAYGRMDQLATEFWATEEVPQALLQDTYQAASFIPRQAIAPNAVKA